VLKPIVWEENAVSDSDGASCSDSINGIFPASSDVGSGATGSNVVSSDAIGSGSVSGADPSVTSSNKTLPPLPPWAPSGHADPSDAEVVVVASLLSLPPPFLVDSNHPFILYTIHPLNHTPIVIITIRYLVHHLYSTPPPTVPLPSLSLGVAVRGARAAGPGRTPN
jgi:hypothetical protein